MVRKRIVFTGRVQGVGFRATARWIAGGRPLTGWVRNEPDGSVLMEVQGDPAAVGEYLDALSTRMGSNIAAQQSSDLPPVQGEERFEIRR